MRLRGTAGKGLHKSLTRGTEVLISLMFRKCHDKFSYFIHCLAAQKAEHATCQFAKAFMSYMSSEV